MSDIDLQDATRRDDVYESLNLIIDKLTAVPVYPQLVWLWAWDIIKHYYDNNQWEAIHLNGYLDECIAQGLELKTIWDKFWEDADSNGWTLEYGAEQMDEAVMDWLRDCDFIVALQDDSWLEDENELEGEPNIVTGSRV